jgi:sRNA-binding carbon storage regulator CsrA
VLPIWRRPGRGFYIGRSVRVTVLEVFSDCVKLGVEASRGIVVSGPDVASEMHLARQVDRELDADDGVEMTSHEIEIGELICIGRGVRVLFKGCDRAEQATLMIDAPRNVAVTRDDFTREEHLAKQARVENGTLAEV